MKSAYERAMERLNQESPSRELSDEEKARIAEIENHAEARIAETKLAYDGKLATANPMEAEVLRQELVTEIARIEEKRDADKDAIWNRES
jgi:hypothetical protein